FVVVHHQIQLLEWESAGSRNVECAANPDIGTLPLRADDGARSSFRAETTRTGLPARVVGVGAEPVTGGLLESVPPLLRRFLRRGDDHLDARRRPVHPAVRRADDLDR